MKNEVNKKLHQLFKQMSAMYKYLGGEDRFRALAYAKAAKVIDALEVDIQAYGLKHPLQDLPGIGEGISDKIEEYLKTGKIEKYENLKKSVPIELLEMMEISGFGAQSLKQINKQLKIGTKKELIEALQNGQLENLKGFGSKKIENMMKGLKLYKTIEDRMLLWDALELGDKIIEWIKQIPNVKKVEIAGSLRRRKETIGDFDILIAAEEKSRKKIIDIISTSKFVEKIIVKGNTKLSIILLESKKQVDFRLVNEDDWGAALQYLTGSKQHNIHLRTIAKNKGFKISEYGIFKIDSEKRIAGKTEEEIYSTLGFQFIPAEMREDRGEIDLASNHQIKELITISDLKGDLQIHTTWSDGINSIEQMVNEVKKNFSYEYIVVTDHSKSLRIANGIDENKLLMQIEAIQLLNKKLGENFVKTGIEVEILADGSLDISDEVLSQLDWVTASIHTNLKKDNTERIIRACQNPYVNCIGHPTGRIIGEREAYMLDIEKVFEIAKQTNTAFEINTQPNRMDLNDRLTNLARKKGVKLVISSDSHSIQNLSYIKLGIDIARRGWCTKEDILTTKSWKELKKLVKVKPEILQLSE